MDFPAGPVVENLPSSAGDAGAIPGWGTKAPHAVEKISLLPQLRGPLVPQPDKAQILQ